jgi:hypothetical protein
MPGEAALERLGKCSHNAAFREASRTREISSQHCQCPDEYCHIFLKAMSRNNAGETTLSKSKLRESHI